MSIVVKSTTKGCVEYCHNKFTKAHLSCGEPGSTYSNWNRRLMEGRTFWNH